MVRDSREAMLERAVADAQRKLDDAKGEHGHCLRLLRKYRRDRDKAAKVKGSA